MPRGTQVKTYGLAITMERRGTSSGIALRHLGNPHSMSGLQRTTLEERLPPEVWVSGVGLKTTRTEGAPGVPTQAPVLITPEEPLVLITVGSQFVDFLLDTGATNSVLTEAPGPISS